MLRKDKIFHLQLSMVIGLISGGILIYHHKDPIYSLAVVMVFGIGKELWDKYIDHEYFDWWDLFMDFLGGIMALWLLLMMMSVILAPYKEL